MTAAALAVPSVGARRSGYALVAVAAMGWGTWPLILRHAPMSPALQSAVLMLMLMLGSLPVMLRDRVRARARPAHWLGVAWLGVSDALNVGLFFAAYQRTSVAIAVLTHYLTPIFVALPWVGPSSFTLPNGSGRLVAPASGTLPSMAKGPEAANAVCAPRPAKARTRAKNAASHEDRRRRVAVPRDALGAVVLIISHS